MKLRNYTILILKITLLCSFLSASSIFSETILLKNGGNIKGKVKGQNAQNLIVETPDGKSQEISKSKVLKVVYKEVSDADLNNIRREEEAKAKNQLEVEKKKSSELEKKIQELEKKLAGQSTSQESEKEIAEKKRLEEEKKKAEDKKREEEKRLQEAKRQEDERESNKFPEQYNRASYLWRSAILPGWGQWKKDEKIKSSLFFFGMILSGGAAYKYDSDFDRAQSSLTKRESFSLLLPAGELKFFVYQGIQKDRSDSVKASNNTFKASLFLGVLYMINLIDAYFYGDISTGKNLNNPYHLKTGIATNAFQSSVGQKKESNFTIQYTWGF